MEESKSSNEKYLEQIASFDPFLNPSDFENIENDINSKKQSKNSNFEFFKDNTDDDSKKISDKPSKISPASTKILSDSEKLKSIHNNSNTFFNSGAHYNESPSRVPLSSLALPQMNQLSSSDSKVTPNVQLTPENSKKIKEKNYKAQSPHHSFNIYRFNNNTNISNSSGNIKNDSYNSNISTQNKKYEVKKYKVSNSVGGTAQDCGPSLRRRSFQQIKSKYNSAYSYKSGRFNITFSSHSEVSQSENSSCEENEKKNESNKKNKKDDKGTPKDTTKNRKVKRFNISYSKNSSNDSTGSLINDFDPENAHLKHASSDKTVGDHHMDNINDNNAKNNLIDFNNDEDEFFYQIQQSSMPVLGRHKKKGNKDGSKLNKTSTNNTNETSPQINNNDNIESNIIDLTISQTNADNNQTKKQNDSININVLSPPKSTPFNPPIFDINMDSTSTANSLLGKFCSRSEDETKESKIDDQDNLINLF